MIKSGGVLAFLWCVLTGGCGQRPLEPRDPDPGAVHFTITTFNILDERASDPATLDAIDGLGTDIIALQEVTPVAEPVIRERFKTKYPYMIFHPSGSAGIGFMSVFPLLEEEFMPGPNGWHPALHVSAKTPAGWLQVLNVHLHAPDGKGIASLQSIADTPGQHRDEIDGFFAQCTNKPTVVLGDFNEDTSGAAVKWLEDRGFENILWLYHPGQPTWQGKSVGGQFSHDIDHVLYGPSLVPLNAWVSPCGVSDHMPVSAHLEFAPSK